MIRKNSKKTVIIDTGQSARFNYGIQQMTVHGIRNKQKCDFGTFECNCAHGFVQRNGTCEDVNECQSFENICGGKECFNLPGSYDCRKESLQNVVQTGYFRSGNGPLRLGMMLDIVIIRIFYFSLLGKP